LNSGEQSPEIYAQLWATITSGREWRGELRNRKKDGSLFWVSASIAPIKSRDGAIDRFLGIQLDITEQKSLLEQLEQTSRLESIGRLAGGVAHDFNNLLTAMMGHAELALLQLDEDHPAAESCQVIRATGERARDLTRQLLAFGREQIIRPRPVDLNAEIDATCGMLDRLIGERVEIEIRPQVGLWAVLADATQVEQVLTNLVVNALDSMPEGGRILIETRNVVHDEAYAATHAEAPVGDFVMLAVSDTGAGMPPEVREKIFEPFFTTKEAGQGTGLGLATVYGIVKQHQGSISVYSEVGHGTTIRIYLPRSKGETI
jgi:signal transduction histidine kinase